MGDVEPANEEVAIRGGPDSLNNLSSKVRGLKGRYWEFDEAVFRVQDFCFAWAMPGVTDLP
jgi:hypothetical protein